MPLATLAELREAALGPRIDLAAQFLDFVALAEQRMAYGGDGAPPLRVLPMEATADLAVTAGVAALPADFLDKRAVYWEGTQTVSVSYEPPSLFYPSLRDRAGCPVPLAYTLEGSSLKISPALTGTIKLLYHKKLTGLSGETSTNDILLKWPGIYLFGTQAERYRVTRDTEQMGLAMRMYGDAVTAANNQAIIARTFGSPLRKRIGMGV